MLISAMKKSLKLHQSPGLIILEEITMEILKVSMKFLILLPNPYGLYDHFNLFDFSNYVIGFLL